MTKLHVVSHGSTEEVVVIAQFVDKVLASDWIHIIQEEILKLF